MRGDECNEPDGSNNRHDHADTTSCCDDEPGALRASAYTKAGNRRVIVRKNGQVVGPNEPQQMERDDPPG